MYRFSFDKEKEKDVIEMLESIPKTLRSRFVVDTIRFVNNRMYDVYYSNREKTRESLTNTHLPDKNLEQNSNEVDFTKIFGGF